MSNLCSEILQVNEASEYNEDSSYRIRARIFPATRLVEHRGDDGRSRISAQTVEAVAIRALTASEWRFDRPRCARSARQ